MRGEYDAHAGLREGARHNPPAPKPKPAPRGLPVLTVAKWVGIVIAVVVVWSLIG
jgi:hypothetical protein